MALGVGYNAEAGLPKFNIQATLSNGSIITLAVGVVNVTEDQTR